MSTVTYLYSLVDIGNTAQTGIDAVAGDRQAGDSEKELLGCYTVDLHPNLTQCLHRILNHRKLIILLKTQEVSNQAPGHYCAKKPCKSGASKHANQHPDS